MPLKIWYFLSLIFLYSISHAQVGYISGPTTVCAGQPADYRWMGGNTNDYYESNYYITSGSGTIGWYQGQPRITWTSGPGVLKLDLAPGDGQTEYATISINVNVLSSTQPAPTVAGDTRFGVGTFTLQASSAGATSYNWYNYTTNALIATGATYTTPLVANSVNNYIKVKASGGCGESVATVVNLTILPIPIASVVGTPYLSLGEATLTTQSGYDTYAWKNGSGQNVGITQTFVVNAAGNYTVTVTKSGLSSTSNTVTINDQLAGLNMNYIELNTVNTTGVTTETGVRALTVQNRSQVIEYYDGLGRALQQISTKQSPLKQDFVNHFDYNGVGLELKKFLPFASQTADGRFKENAIRILDTYEGNIVQYYEGSDHHTFYHGTNDKIIDDDQPYSETKFEPSPLNRILKIGSPGAVWQPNTSAYTAPTDRAQARAYDFNLASEVLLWTYTPPAAGLPLGLVNAGTAAAPTYYAVDQLFRIRSKDEEHNEVIEYIDKQGRVVLKRMQVATGSPSTTDANKDVNFASTYYVYDDFGGLVCVIPPQATSRLATDFYQSGSTNTTKDAFLKKWAFRYNYDERRRINQKQLPGAEPVYMVYDKLDRLVLTQDGNQRNISPTKQWTFTKYDELGRPVMTGWLANGNDLVTAQNEVNNFYEPLTTGKAFFESYIAAGTGNVLGYDNKSYPNVTAEAQYYTVTYYDVYDTYNAPTGYTYLNESLPGQETAEFKRNGKINGQITGMLVKNLATNTWLRTTNFYDDEYQLIQGVTTHQRGTTPTRASNVYDFPGRLVISKRTYSVNSVNRSVKETYTYDHAGRVLNLKHSINGGADIMIQKSEYNELGQLVDKKLHSTDNGSTFKQSVDYQFNIRGWLTKINEADVGPTATGDAVPDYFGMELQYNNSTAGLTSSPVYNGNISAMRWSKGNGGTVKKHSYSFIYDPLNRLRDANHYDYQRNPVNGNLEWASNSNGYSEVMQYDLNGNINSLVRKGFKGASMDNLTYLYNGNQLSYVNDAADATKGFINGNTGTDDFSYDFNGNLDKDKNKGLSNKGDIKYNHLNLPIEVTKGTEKVKYVYDAMGRKLAQEVYNTSGVLAKVTDYIGELVFEGTSTPVLQFMQHAEGRTLPDGAGWEYQYHLKDHLGNVRITFTTKTPAPTSYTTNFEAATNSNFQNYTNTSYDLVDHTDPAGTVYQKVQWLNGGANGKVGLAKSVSVMPGDEVTITAYAKYMNLGTTGNSNAFITSLAAAFGVSSSSTGEDLKKYNGLNNYTLTVPGGDHLGDDELAPKAFVTIIFFDKDYNFLDAAWDQVSNTNGPQTSATVKQPPHDVMSIAAKAPEAGYAYVFLSNEHPYYLDVYFDDVTVNVLPSPVVGVSDYYPFGLTFNSSARENSIANSNLFQSQEIQDELSINMYQFEFRMHDPTIGRFISIDPLSEAYAYNSPYAFAENRVVDGIDLEGLEWRSATTEEAINYVENGSPVGQGAVGYVTSIDGGAGGYYTWVGEHQYESSCNPSSGCIETTRTTFTAKAFRTANNSVVVLGQEGEVNTMTANEHGMAELPAQGTGFVTHNRNDVVRNGQAQLDQWGTPSNLVALMNAAIAFYDNTGGDAVSIGDLSLPDGESPFLYNSPDQRRHGSHYDGTQVDWRYPAVGGQNFNYAAVDAQSVGRIQIWMTGLRASGYNNFILSPDLRNRIFTEQGRWITGNSTINGVMYRFNAEHSNHGHAGIGRGQR